MRQIIKRLELRLRARMPARLRSLAHTIRSLGPIEVSKPLPAALVADCQFCASRVDMLDRLPRQGIVAELGTYRGDFAREILARTDPRELHLVDIDYALFDESGLTEAGVQRHRGFTYEIIAAFPDAYFDWIYVDADHSYDGTMRDARASAAKVKPGGFLVFNDFAHIDPYLSRYGVHRAVVDFALETQWPFSFFAFETAALYDVALRKPS